MSHHPTAIIDSSAALGDSVEVGPFAVIGAGAQIGDQCLIGAHVCIGDGTVVGTQCRLHTGAVLGGPPQHRGHPEDRSGVRIGDRNELREYVTIHGATDPEGGTVLGDDNYLMAYSHAGHDVHIGSGVTIANMVQLGGHVIVEDGVVIGGLLGVHQFVRIGKYAMVGGLSRVTQDIPPFMLTEGSPARVMGVNRHGMRRAGLDADAQQSIKQAYRLLFRAKLNLSDALQQVRDTLPMSEPLQYLIDFLSRLQNGHAGRQNDPMGVPVAVRETHSVGAPHRRGE